MNQHIRNRSLYTLKWFKYDLSFLDEKNENQNIVEISAVNDLFFIFYQRDCLSMY